MKRFDILIIGAGAVGNAIAREITKKKKVSVAVLEKEPDTAFGISGRNSGVLHAGFNNKPGSLMAKLCVMGSKGFAKEAEELGIPFQRTGKLVIARYQEDRERLLRLKEQGDVNGVEGLQIIGQEELFCKIGYDAGVAALWSEMTGIFDPFQYTVALAETAVLQGAEYFFGRQVTGISSIANSDSQVTGISPATKFSSQTGKGSKSGMSLGKANFVVTAENLSNGQNEQYEADILINSAGLFADEICRMVGVTDYTIYPCRGEYHILSKRNGHNRMDKPGGLTIPIYPIPNEREGGLGVHLTPTIHGNIMIGPSAEYLMEEQGREEYGTTWDVMERLRQEGSDLFPMLDAQDIIRSFAGIRPKLASESQGGYADFVISENSSVPGFIQLVGIESPGLTSSIPIGRMVAQMTEEIMARDRFGIDGNNSNSGYRNDFGHRTVPLREPGDQKMICRCEGITEAAILEAYDRIAGIGAIPTIKGLKNRTRVTMGNCQGSFCTINMVELLQKRRDMDPFRLLWNGFGSRMLEGRVRE